MKKLLICSSLLLALLGPTVSAGSIEGPGWSIPISTDAYLPTISIIDGYVPDVQTPVDAGMVLNTESWLNVSDGQTTYLAGHNPGIMSPLANSFYEGMVVEIVDHSGKKRNYKLRKLDQFVKRQTLYAGESHVSDAIHHYYGEAIVIQYCVADTYYYILGLPTDDVVQTTEKPVEPAPKTESVEKPTTSVPTKEPLQYVLVDSMKTLKAQAISSLHTSEISDSEKRRVIAQIENAGSRLELELITNGLETPVIHEPVKPTNSNLLLSITQFFQNALK